jgi:plasmid stability protein
MFSNETMVMLQIRNVPPDLHERLKQRAASKGMNLSDYLKRELDRIASIPTNEELFAEIEADRQAGRLIATSRDEILDAIREGRESR